jgi:hypothetical protein
MCIIAIYSNGKRPQKNTIETMMKRNPDGVGIAWNTGKHVFFKKGLTTVDGVMALMGKLDFARDIVFHARIATSGGVSAEKCHPFPVSGDNATLDRTTYAGKNPVVFHNGVFNISIDNGLNDSQTFVKKSLYPIFRADPRGLSNGKYNPIINMAVSGSRLVILYPDGFYAYGNGWQEDDGVWYSNSGYKETERSKYWTASWDDWYEEYSYASRGYSAKTPRTTGETHAYGDAYWKAHEQRKKAQKTAKGDA